MNEFAERAREVERRLLKPRDVAEDIVARGADVHPHCGHHIGILIHRAKDLGGVNTMHAGRCAWCDEVGGVSTVIDYISGTWWD